MHDRIGHSKMKAFNDLADSLESVHKDNQKAIYHAEKGIQNQKTDSYDSDNASYDSYSVIVSP